MSSGNDDDVKRLRNSAEAERLLKQFRKTDGSPAATDDYRARYELTFMPEKKRAVAMKLIEGGMSIEEAVRAAR